MKVQAEFHGVKVVLYIPELNERYDEDDIILGIFRGVNMWFWEQLLSIYDFSRYNLNLLFSNSALESNIPRPTADYIKALARGEGRAGS